jgi:cytochrome c oxidase subunit 2
MRLAPIAGLVSLIALADPALAAWGMPDAINPRLETISDIYLQILLVGTLVFVVVFGWMTYNLVKFRPGGEGQATDEDHRGSVKAEVVWTVIPLLIVAWVGMISYDGLAELNELPEDPAAEINVNGYQWFWEFDYGDGIVLNQQSGDDGSLTDEEPFLIPANEPVVVNVTGMDVQHAFKIAELGVMLDAVPGQNNYQSFTAPEDEYLIQCAEMCGNPGHAYMNAKLKAVPMQEYQDWIEDKRAEARAGGLQHDVEVTLTDDGFDRDTYQGVADVETVFTVANDDGQERTVTLDEADASVTVPAGETATFNATVGQGAYTLTAGEAEATLDVLAPESVSVELDEWAIRSDTDTFETGQPYLVEVENVGNSVHNLYIGTPEEEGGEDEVLYNSDDLRSGDATTVLVFPDESETGEWTWWCDIPGHYGEGMAGSITIQ